MQCCCPVDRCLVPFHFFTHAGDFLGKQWLKADPLIEPVQLSLRLQTIADFIPSGLRLIDIGTDHGWLPIYLLHHERICAAIGIDRAPASLKKARSNQIEANLYASNLQWMHADGISSITPSPNDVLVLAGMGGQTMVTILQSLSPTQVHSLILQPNRGAEHLRRFLSATGWQIKQERMVFEKSHFYPIMVVVSGFQSLSDEQCFLGPMLLLERSPEWRQWLRHQRQILAQIQRQSKEKMPLVKQQQLNWVLAALNC